MRSIVLQFKRVSLFVLFLPWISSCQQGKQLSSSELIKRIEYLVSHGSEFMFTDNTKSSLLITHENPFYSDKILNQSSERAYRIDIDSKAKQVFIRRKESPSDDWRTLWISDWSQNKNKPPHLELSENSVNFEGMVFQMMRASLIRKRHLVSLVSNDRANLRAGLESCGETVPCYRGDYGSELDRNSFCRRGLVPLSTKQKKLICVQGRR